MSLLQKIYTLIKFSGRVNNDNGGLEGWKVQIGGRKIKELRQEHGSVTSRPLRIVTDQPTDQQTDKPTDRPQPTDSQEESWASYNSKKVKVVEYQYGAFCFTVYQERR